MNDGIDVEKRTTIASVTDSIMKPEAPRQNISDKHPGLMKELNDSQSQIPAYMRFQNQEEC